MQNHDFLGCTLTDVVTGFAGVCVGYAVYLEGDTRLMVQPKASDGAWVEGQWFDAERVEIDTSVPRVDLGD